MIPETPSEPPFQKGFTLVEIMAAVSILALISAMVFTVVFGAVKRSRFIDRELELQTEAGSILSLVMEDLRGAFYTEGDGSFFQGEDRFYGDIPADQMNFLTTSVLPVDPGLSLGSGGEVGYVVSTAEEGRLYLFRREQAPLSAPFEEGGEQWEVTDRLASFDLSYSDGEEWYDEWDSTTGAGPSAGKLPAMVRITFSLREGGQEVTSTGIVAPVISAGR